MIACCILQSSRLISLDIDVKIANDCHSKFGEIYFHYTYRKKKKKRWKFKSQFIGIECVASLKTDTTINNAMNLSFVERNFRNIYADNKKTKSRKKKLKIIFWKIFIIEEICWRFGVLNNCPPLRASFFFISRIKKS